VDSPAMQSPVRTSRRSTASSLRWSATARKTRTRCRRGRRAQKLGPRLRFLPVTRSRGGWSWAKASVLRELVYDEILQRKNIRPSVRGSAEGEEEREAREGVRAAPPSRYQ
jgi:hypothetical protein